MKKQYDGPTKSRKVFVVVAMKRFAKARMGIVVRGVYDTQRRAWQAAKDADRERRVLVPSSDEGHYTIEATFTEAGADG